jgi:hypothetical protein
MPEEAFRKVITKAKRARIAAPTAAGKNPLGESNSRQSVALPAEFRGFVQDPNDAKMLLCLGCSKSFGRQGAKSHQGSEKCKRARRATQSSTQQQTIAGMLVPARTTN